MGVAVKAPSVVVAAALVIALTGCGTETATDPAMDPSEPAPSASPTGGGKTGQPVKPAAVRFFQAWARPQLDYPQWWSDLKPLLNEAGRQAYAGTDPSTIPTLRVNGPARELPSTVDTYGLVRIPTSAGRFIVQLQRPSAEAKWRVTRLWFPGTTPPTL